MTTTNYQQQATDFLSKTNTTFKATFLKNGKHFEDDKDTRDIYEIELKRGPRVYKFNFGQSLNCSGEWLVNDKNPKFRIAFNDKIKAHDFARNIGNPYNVIKNPNFKVPSSYDVLACLTKYHPGTFEDFCADFGYDEDSKRAEKIYLDVVNEYRNVAMLFNEAELEELQEIQ